jgi:hypothetical protein
MGSLNTDYRVDVGFWRHRKTLRLIRLVGLEGPVCVQRLWAHAAEFIPNGDLSDMDAIDIADAAEWKGEANSFLEIMIEQRWIDKKDGGLFLHDWEEHQTWVVKAPERREKAKKAASARWENCKENATSNATSMQQAMLNNATSNAPSPSPLPSPTPKDITEVITSVVPPGTNGNKKADKVPSCPYKEILELYREILPELRQIEWNDDRATQMRVRWREKPERQNLGWWKWYFELVRQCPWLMGENEKNWTADLDWLTGKKNMPKVLDGKYKSRNQSCQTAHTSIGNKNMKVAEAYLKRKGIDPCKTS